MPSQSKTLTPFAPFFINTRTTQTAGTHHVLIFKSSTAQEQEKKEKRMVLFTCLYFLVYVELTRGQMSEFSAISTVPGDVGEVLFVDPNAFGVYSYIFLTRSTTLVASLPTGFTYSTTCISYFNSSRVITVIASPASPPPVVLQVARGSSQWVTGAPLPSECIVPPSFGCGASRLSCGGTTYVADYNVSSGSWTTVSKNGNSCSYGMISVDSFSGDVFFSDSTQNAFVLNSSNSVKSLGVLPFSGYTGCDRFAYYSGGIYAVRQLNTGTPLVSTVTSFFNGISWSAPVQEQVRSCVSFVIPRPIYRTPGADGLFFYSGFFRDQWGLSGTACSSNNGFVSTVFSTDTVGSTFLANIQGDNQYFSCSSCGAATIGLAGGYRLKPFSLSLNVSSNLYVLAGSTSADALVASGRYDWYGSSSSPISKSVSVIFARQAWSNTTAPTATIYAYVMGGQCAQPLNLMLQDDDPVGSTFWVGPSSGGIWINPSNWYPFVPNSTSIPVFTTFNGQTVTFVVQLSSGAYVGAVASPGSVTFAGATLQVAGVAPFDPACFRNDVDVQVLSGNFLALPFLGGQPVALAGGQTNQRLCVSGSASVLSNSTTIFANSFPYPPAFFNGDVVCYPSSNQFTANQGSAFVSFSKSFVVMAPTLKYSPTPSSSFYAKCPIMLSGYLGSGAQTSVLLVGGGTFIPELGFGIIISSTSCPSTVSLVDFSSISLSFVADSNIFALSSGSVSCAPIINFVFGSLNTSAYTVTVGTMSPTCLPTLQTYSVMFKIASVSILRGLYGSGSLVLPGDLGSFFSWRRCFCFYHCKACSWLVYSDSNIIQPECPGCIFSVLFFSSV